MRAKLTREVAELGLPEVRISGEPVREEDIASFPEPAQRYLRFMGVVGKPRVGSFRARATGRFRRSPDEPWMDCEAFQYNMRTEITRIFHMRLRLRGMVPVYVRDTYLRGEGRMLGRVFDTFTVVDAADDKVRTGELVTYLNDAILLAPSMIIGPEAEFAPVDDRAFDVALTDRGHTVRARVFVDDFGAVTDFSTTDRYGADPAAPGEMIRTRWSTPVHAWAVAQGRPMPASASAVWHFTSGDLEYAVFNFRGDEIEFDVSPNAT